MSGLTKAQELRRKRKGIHDKIVALFKAAHDEGRDLTSDELEQAQKMDEECDSLKAQYELIEKNEDRARDIETIIDREKRDDGRPVGGDTPEDRSKALDAAFRTWLRRGPAALDEEQRKLLMERTAELTPEQRALAAETDASGGFTVPEGFWNQLIEDVKAFGGMRQARTTVITTDSGNTLPVPTSTDVANVGQIVGENVQETTEADPTFGAVNLGAFLYSTKIVRVSLQLLQDSAFNIEEYLRRKLAERLARIQNTHFTTGTGSGQPNGVVTASSVGKTGATGQTTSIIYEDLVDLQHSIDPALRMNAEWMMHDDSLKIIKKIKDSDGRPLWSAGVAVREPDTILGHRYIINQDVAQMAANAKSVLFGDFSKYWVRDVRGFVLMQLRERWADFFQVGFLGFLRSDGDLIDAGTDPIKHYANSAT